MEEGSRRNFLSNYFVPRRGYFVTPVIFFLNLLLYLFVSVYDGNFFLPKGETIILLGGDTPSLTLNGEWWRIITSCFLHFGILHFAFNMFALIQLGKAIEDFVGSMRMAVVYLFCGIAGGTASNWWYNASLFSVSAGASGAIFGLLGFFLALVTTEFVRKEVRWPLIKSIGGSVLLNLALSTFAQFNNAAHIGGLLAGIFAGYCMWIIFKLSRANSKIIFCLLILFSSISLFGFILPLIPKTAVQLNSFLERVETQKLNLENQTEQHLKMPTLSEADTILFIEKWSALSLKMDSLKMYKEDVELSKMIAIRKKEIQFRKRETTLLICVNAGNKSKMKELKAIQDSLRNLLSENDF
jgi:rhomboid protease GluP